MEIIFCRSKSKQFGQYGPSTAVSDVVIKMRNARLLKSCIHTFAPTNTRSAESAAEKFDFAPPGKFFRKVPRLGKKAKTDLCSDAPKISLHTGRLCTSAY